MTDARILKNVCTLTLLFILLTAAGCNQSKEPEPEVDYSKEGPDGPNAQTEFTETESGLKYKILREGTGKKPAEGDYVRVSFRVWLDDGTEVESSYPTGKPSDFALDRLLPGWQEGLRLIGEGGKIELSIPPELGFGDSGNPPNVPPNVQLHYLIELHDVSD